MAKLTYREVAPRPKHRVFPRSIFDKLFGNQFMRETFVRWSVHGVVPIVLGAAVVIDGHAAIQIRSAGVLLCAAWLATDIGIELSKKNWSAQAKAIGFSALTTVIFCAAMACMYWFFLTLLEKQQDDTFDGLEAKIELPPSKINLDSTYTFTNNSHNEIGRHTLFCRILAGEAPHTVIRNATEFFSSESDQPIEPGKDGETQSCVNGPKFTFLKGPEDFLNCMDVEIGIQYTLTSQPDVVREKKLRFVSDVSAGYEWRQERLKAETSLCSNLRFDHSPRHH